MNYLETPIDYAFPCTHAIYNYIKITFGSVMKLHIIILSIVVIGIIYLIGLLILHPQLGNFLNVI